MSTKHTPGPWRTKISDRPTDGEYDCAILSVSDSDGRTYVIAEAFGRVGENKRINAHETGERIVACVNACEGINPAAVPEMLAALKLIEECYPLRDKWTKPHLALRTLIAKAEGK